MIIGTTGVICNVQLCFSIRWVPRTSRKERKSSFSVALSVTPSRRLASTRRVRTWTDSLGGKPAKHQGSPTPKRTRIKVWYIFIFIHQGLVIGPDNAYNEPLVYINININSRNSQLDGPLCSIPTFTYIWTFINLYNFLINSNRSLFSTS